VLVEPVEDRVILVLSRGVRGVCPVVIGT
jgi:hypothetical protein